MFPAIAARTLRTLDLASPLDDGRAYVAAASGLALAGGRLVVVGDDLAHIVSFTEDPAAPGTAHRVLPDVLPAGHAERKRRKPDLEALTALPASPAFPHGALLAVGSGSTPARERAVLVPLDAAGAPADGALVRDLAGMLAPLREHRDEVNVEAALVLGDELVLVSRAHSAMPENLVARFALAAVAAWADGAAAAPAPRSVAPWRVGEIGGVPLGVTDAAAHPGGGWVFSAAAEDTADAYDDGAVAGAVVGRVDAAGAVVAIARLTPTVKVEGILARRTPGGTELLMVTDADDPDAPASLLAAVLPG
ncbi:MAG: hypothetical protein IT200_03905 [Thermoleophilia bacterium]|nr:hypothetical protein [Thermoleophilia bacterium]